VLGGLFCCTAQCSIRSTVMKKSCISSSVPPRRGAILPRPMLRGWRRTLDQQPYRGDIIWTEGQQRSRRRPRAPLTTCSRRELSRSGWGSRSSFSRSDGTEATAPSSSASDRRGSATDVLTSSPGSRSGRSRPSLRLAPGPRRRGEELVVLPPPKAA
jgi:hypothetical protein